MKKNIQSVEHLYNFMRENIKYGFISSIDKKAYRRVEVNDDELYEKMLIESYYLQTPEELLKSKYGLCYDQVELERKWLLDKGYKVLTFFSTHHNHSFLIFKDKYNYYLFERTFPGYNGIYKTNSLEECLNIYKKIQFEKAKSDLKEIKIYPYENVKFGINFNEYKKYGQKRKDEELLLKR